MAKDGYQHTSQTVQSPGAATSPHGTPVYIRTETAVPASAPIDPTSFEFWTPILAFVILVAGVLALFSKHITGKFSEFEKVHRPAHEAIDKTLHRLANEASTDRARINTLERSRENDVQRIVALEINMAHIKDSQGRIEHQLEKMEAEGAKGRAEIIESLRELREVKPRS